MLHQQCATVINPVDMTSQACVPLDEQVGYRANRLVSSRLSTEGEWNKRTTTTGVIIQNMMRHNYK